MDLNPQPFETRLKVASFVIFVLLFLLVAPARWFGMQKQTYQKNEALPTLDELTIQSVNDDTDNDGIPNWKENLLGTNPKVKNATDQSVVEKTPDTPEDKKALARLDDPRNMTSQFIKNTVGISTYLGQQNASGEDVINSVSAGVAEQAKSLSEAKTYSEKDLKITRDESVVSLKKYGNAIALLFLNTYHSIDPETVLSFIQEYQKTKDVKTLHPYEEKAVLLSQMIVTLLGMPVPDSAVELHLYLINSSEQYRIMLLNFSVTDSDPMRAFVAVSKYKEVTGTLGTIITSYSDYFMKKNVIFTPKENAYFFTKVILSK